MTGDFKNFLRDHTNLAPGQFYGASDDVRLRAHAEYLKWRDSDRIPAWWTDWRIWLLGFVGLVVAVNVGAWR